MARRRIVLEITPRGRILFAYRALSRDLLGILEHYRALKANGVETRLYMAPREPHVWRELRHELFKINVELDWFEKLVRGRSYEWARPPRDGEEETRRKTTDGNP